MFDPNKLTTKAKEALAEAQRLSIDNQNSNVEIFHLLKALVLQDEGIVGVIIEKSGIDNKILLEKIEKEIATYPQATGDINPGQISASNEMTQVLDKSSKTAEKNMDEFISTEHLFLGAVHFSDKVKGMLWPKLSVNKIENILKDLKKGEKITDPDPESKLQALNKYGIDLTDMAKEGKLDPVIGRDNEIRRVMQVLSRRTKNNPVLIGEPGVGKTAIVEGIAQRIVNNDVPESLQGRKIVSLDMGSLLAGAKFRGEFEQRFKAVLKEIEKSEGKIITFIDELHTLVGAGSSEGAVDASNMIKPALARGILHTIGATTLQEYQKHIEKDAALERRFQPIMIKEPNVNDSIAILRGLKERYEIHHGVQITDKAIVAAVKFSDRYITNRFLPDKAVDLIDEAASVVKMSIDSRPEELDKYKREELKMEIELKALEKEKKRGSDKDEVHSKILRLKKKLGESREKSKEIELRWQTEKKSITDLRRLKKQLQDLKHDAESLEQAGDLGKVAEIRYGDIPELEKKIKSGNKRLTHFQGERSLLKEQVTDEDIARLISRMTSIPVSKMLEAEQEKLANLEDYLQKKVVGQERVLRSLANAIRRNRAGLGDENRPVGVFMFLGPTGVGKTETVKALAEYLFNSEKTMIRIDMSEYMEPHSVAKLIGSPPGYIGFDEGGQLTEAVRRNPYNIVLFDEIEKAHPEVFNLFLQIFDEGRLTDAKGRTVNFKNTILVMTSNIGAELIQKSLAAEKGLSHKDEHKVHDIVAQRFKPEFINRLDEVLIFKALGKDQVRSIVKIKLEDVAERLIQKKIKFEFDKSVTDYLAKKGYDPAFGARPINRLIDNDILNPLSLKIVKNEIKEKSLVKVGIKNGQIEFEIR